MERWRIPLIQTGLISAAVRQARGGQHYLQRVVLLHPLASLRLAELSAYLPSTTVDMEALGS